ncbi:unnamed protein product [Durusdinium trenchii]
MCGRPPAGPLTGRPLTGAQRDKSLAVVFLLLACISLILERRGRDGGFALSYTPKPLSRHMAGLLWSAVAIVGRPMASALRKELATPRAGKAVSNAEQVGMTSLIQGAVAMTFMFRDQDPLHSFHSLPMIFWICLASSSFLNAIIKTAETHAYKVGEMSLCAPFLAFDPVIQLLVGTMVLPLFSGGWPCAPSLRKASAVACIAAGMLALSMTDQARAGQRGLPKGAGFIILNCFLYSATYRLDAAAVGVSSSLCLFAYCRLIMAAMCFSSTRLWKRGREGDSTGLWEPRALLLLIFVCVVDAAYMLSMYQAVSLISPVLVSAVKRGGGIVVSALFGAIFFNEKLEGRKQLLFVVAVGEPGRSWQSLVGSGSGLQINRQNHLQYIVI